MSLDHKKKGRLNKIKVGDKLKPTKAVAEWYASHLVENFSRPNNGDREIDLTDTHDVLFWTLVHQSGILPQGVAIHYGAEDYDDKKKKHISRKCVFVHFKLPKKVTDVVGKTLEYSAYFEEKNLVKVTRK